MPSLLPRYQRFRRMTGQVDGLDADIEPAQRRRTRSGSTGNLETLSASQLDLKNKLSRQASEGVTHEVRVDSRPGFLLKSRLSLKCTPLWFQNRAMPRLGNELTLDSRPLSRLSTHNTSSETNVLVAWVERFEDHAQFPVDELLMEFDFGGDAGHSLRDKDTVVIFIHHLTSGLYRIHIRSTIR